MTRSPDSPSALVPLPPALEFAPVPVRARRDGWTHERQRLYVAALARWGSGSRAAAAAGLTEQSAARLRARPGGASFQGACERAWQVGKRLRREDREAAAVARPGTEVFHPREAETSETSEPSAALSSLPQRRRAEPSGKNEEACAARFRSPRPMSGRRYK